MFIGIFCDKKQTKLFITRSMPLDLQQPFETLMKTHHLICLSGAEVTQIVGDEISMQSIMKN